MLPKDRRQLLPAVPGGAAEEAATMVAAVRHDPALRLRLAGRVYDRQPGRVPIRAYRRAAVAFLRGAVRRGGVAPLESRGARRRGGGAGARKRPAAARGRGPALLR